jgi:membrane associated rhomboid family serine protease
MLIPWGTDAPIYHWPIATVVMIVVTSIAFWFTGSADRFDFEPVEEEQAESVEAGNAKRMVPESPDEVEPEEGEGEEDAKATAAEEAESNRVRELLLVHGKGLHPLQWLSSNFVHGNIWHLLGNMIFLWAFGIIVEGKIGWYGFLPVYLGLGIIQCASEQVLTLGASESYSFGASAIIYGLLAMCLVWAPKNDLNCFVTYGFRFGNHEIPIMIFAILYLGVEVITVILSGFTLGSSLLHLTGALLGFALATVLLKMGWVDCENWDLFAVVKGTHGKAETKPTRKKKKKSRSEAAARDSRVNEGDDEPAAVDKSAEAKSAAMLERLRRAIAEGHAGAALAIYQKLSKTPSAWEPPETELQALIKLVQQEKMWAESVPLLEQYVRRFPAKSARVRLKLAQVLIRDQQRPVQALRVLAEIPKDSLPKELEQLRLQLEQKATQMRDDGVLELEGENW